MANFSMKQGGKEVGPAQVYAPPHTMSGKKMTIPNTGGYPATGTDSKTVIPESIVTFGRRFKSEPIEHIEMRGYGAATRGRKFRTTL
jgi:hypothetical protein